MEVLADDAPDKASVEDVEDMLMEMRQFVNEHASNPSHEIFNDWSKRSSGTCERHFGSWNKAVVVAGRSPNQPSRLISEKDALDGLDNAAEQRIEYKIDGEDYVSPEGEAPPSTHITHIDSVDNLPPNDNFYKRNFDRTYTKLAVERGHDTVERARSGNSYDWDEVEETLTVLIEEEVEEEVGLDTNTIAREDEIPPNQYIKNRDDLPSPDRLRDRYGLRENWKYELDIEEERNANDVDVDPTDFGL